MTGSGVRQLKAIMFTDIKGFSAMMGKDEERTMRLVQEHREIVRATLPDHSGHEHETIGDAFVVLFDSAVNAVQCAADIQTKFRVRNAAQPEEEQVWIRIGIHVGDIILQDGDIYGDGVNIAARVEPQAEPGGICITQDVFVQVRKKVTLRAISIGKKELKNITDAPELYRILLEGDPEPVDAAAPEWPKPLLWKTILWFALTMPWALFLLLGPFLAANWHEGILTSFGLPPDSPRALSIALSVVLGAGMIRAIFSAAGYWRRGVPSPWLHGHRFLIFPVLGLLLLAFHFMTLRGQVT
ncbi:MAG: hypothetical protein JRF63_07500, partial [Deltaproteobacteria bacterium]|nr:hypothetical protein [Deltaproteobacteria bacterium]